VIYRLPPPPRVFNPRNCTPPPTTPTPQRVSISRRRWRRPPTLIGGPLRTIDPMRRWLPRPRSSAKTFALYTTVCVHCSPISYHGLYVDAWVRACVKKQQSNKTRTMCSRQTDNNITSVVPRLSFNILTYIGRRVNHVVVSLARAQQFISNIMCVLYYIKTCLCV